MKKSISKIAFLVALLMLVTVCLSSCGNKSGDTNKPAADNGTKTETAAAEGFNGTKYVYEGNLVSLPTKDIPESYQLVPYEKFEAAFKAIAVDKTITTSSTYSDVAALFGDDGLKVAGLVVDGYAYYTWYSDKDANGSKKVNVALTFKDDGKKLTYYAYSSDTITPKDFE